MRAVFEWCVLRSFDGLCRVRRPLLVLFKYATERWSSYSDDLDYSLGRATGK